MQTTIKVHIDSTVKDMNESVRYAKTFSRSAVAEATFLGMGVAESLAPTDTGSYKGTFRTEFSNTGSQFYGEFGTDDERGYALELGGHTGSGLGWHPGQPHFIPAALAAEKKLHQGMERVANNV